MAQSVDMQLFREVSRTRTIYIITAIISSNVCRVAIIFSMEENNSRGGKDADKQKDTAVTVRITSSLKTEQLKTAKKLKKEV